VVARGASPVRRRGPRGASSVRRRGRAGHLTGPATWSAGRLTGPAAWSRAAPHGSGGVVARGASPGSGDVVARLAPHSRTTGSKCGATATIIAASSMNWFRVDCGRARPGRGASAGGDVVARLARRLRTTGSKCGAIATIIAASSMNRIRVDLGMGWLADWGSYGRPRVPQRAAAWSRGARGRLAANMQL
jgi:hypothetical protein